MIIADGAGLVDQSQISSKYFERNITRAEMAKVLDAALRYFDLREPTLLDTNVFVDQIDLKYKLSVHNLYEKKIISGYSDNTFRPNNKATRAEAAVMILKMFDPSYR